MTENEVGVSKQRVERIRFPRKIEDYYNPNDTLFGRFFRNAKREKLLVKVCDRWGQEISGRVYRNSYDRVNVVPIDNPNNSREIYYHDMTWAEVVGKEPEGLAPFFVDWDCCNDDHMSNTCQKS